MSSNGRRSVDGPPPTPSAGSSSSSSASSPLPPPSQSARSSRKVPLPRYTSIDLENELPEIFSTSLNPNLHDPDMSMFFNRHGPPVYHKRASPPPSYVSHRTSHSLSSSSSSSSGRQGRRRGALLLGLFGCAFFVFPLFVLLFFYAIPRLVIADVGFSRRGVD